MDRFAFMIIRFVRTDRPSALQQIYFPYIFEKIKRNGLFLLLFYRRRMFYVFTCDLHFICVAHQCRVCFAPICGIICDAGPLGWPRRWLNNNKNGRFTQSDVARETHRWLAY